MLKSFCMSLTQCHCTLLHYTLCFLEGERPNKTDGFFITKTKANIAL